MKRLHFKTSEGWRKWLVKNHNKESGIWMEFYKKKTGKKSIEYDFAVEEALCYGWIDSIIKRIDEEKYVIKFTPRKDNSNWSESNKKRVALLIKSKKMTEYGLEKIKAAKKNGQWDKSVWSSKLFQMPAEFKKALDKNKKALENFNKLAPSYQRHYIGWIVNAKREETKLKYVKESIALLEEGKKLGMK
ncbi:YdeI family protein [Bacteroidota bacterium]